MNLFTLQVAVLVTSLSFMLAQLFVSKKHTSHILFAMFCGSVALMTVKQLSGEILGSYKYLIGMAACATCNGYWLLSRSIFRGKQSIALHHILVAAVIALLIMLNQGLQFVSSSDMVSLSSVSLLPHALSELTVLLSSCIIVLSFWEGCRGFTTANKVEKMQRGLFLATFAIAVSISKISQGLLVDDKPLLQVVMSCIVLLVLTNTQLLLLWRAKSKVDLQQNEVEIVNDSKSEGMEGQQKLLESLSPDELALANKVQSLIIDKQMFLQANLKVADLARELAVPEYRISTALRNKSKGQNFNQYINALRVDYAKVLLADPSAQQWSVLVIGLESGFASVGPFTRAFKSITGCTPNQYRQQRIQLQTA